MSEAEKYFKSKNVGRKGAGLCCCGVIVIIAICAAVIALAALSQ